MMMRMRMMMMAMMKMMIMIKMSSILLVHRDLDHAISVYFLCILMVAIAAAEIPPWRQASELPWAPWMWGRWASPSELVRCPIPQAGYQKRIQSQNVSMHSLSTESYGLRDEHISATLAISLKRQSGSALEWPTISLGTSDDFCKSTDFVRYIRQAWIGHQWTTEHPGTISEPISFPMLAHKI
jgi:hypothetical protein